MADTKTLVGIVVLLVVLAGAALFVLPALAPGPQPTPTATATATIAPTATPVTLATPTPAATPAPASLEAEYGVDPQSVERNTLLYTALFDAGVEDAFVDVTKERVLVRYELPENYSSKNLAYYVFGLAEGLEPNSGKVLIQVMSGDQAVEEWEAATSDIKSFSDGALTTEQFDAKVRHATL